MIDPDDAKYERVSAAIPPIASTLARNSISDTLSLSILTCPQLSIAIFLMALSNNV